MTIKVPTVASIEENKEKIPLRLNSEDILGEDSDDLYEEFSPASSSSEPIKQSEDSCSGYCSGSGCSLPSSPIPDDQEEEQVSGGECREELPAQVPLRRDSDTSDGSCENEIVDDVEVSPEVVGKIVSQVENMFSDDHLAKDGFLLKHVRRRSDGFVSLKLVAGLRKVKQISREFPVVLTALKKSDRLEVNPEGTKIRRKEPLTQNLKSMPIKLAKKEKNSSQETLKAEKENQSAPTTISDEQQIARRRRRGDRLNELQGNGKSLNSRNSLGEDCSPQSLRRRGGSLPIPSAQHRGSLVGNYLYPSGSPPAGFLRPKSNSYSEGTDASSAASGMSSWLQKRKASASSRLSSGDISLGGVLRQPRGPDGTKGFHPGYRALINEEKLQREMSVQLGTFSA